MDNLFYDIRWTNDLDERFIQDFLYVQNEVFKCGTREEFKRQFENNIYGKSIIVVVYRGENPIAARVIWRNDIEGQEAYQPGCTSVLPICRGKGVFKEMTLRALAYLPSNAIIYNYPNDNSFQGYVKLGWNCLKEYRARLFLSYKTYKIEHNHIIDAEYANWWLKDRDLYYKKMKGHYFLLQKDRRLLCYHILGEVSSEVAKNYSRIHLGVIFYKSTKITWYNKHLGVCRVVAKNHVAIDVPNWKIDAI